MDFYLILKKKFELLPSQGESLIFRLQLRKVFHICVEKRAPLLAYNKTLSSFLSIIFFHFTTSYV